MRALEKSNFPSAMRGDYVRMCRRHRPQTVNSVSCVNFVRRRTWKFVRIYIFPELNFRRRLCVLQNYLNVFVIIAMIIMEKLIFEELALIAYFPLLCFRHRPHNFDGDDENSSEIPTDRSHFVPHPGIEASRRRVAYPAVAELLNINFSQ